MSHLIIILYLSLLPLSHQLVVGEHSEWILAGRSTAEIAPSPDLPDSPPLSNSTFALAAGRTLRKDPLDGYALYSGGWNISNHHYWTSVGFTGAPFFVIGVVWFIGFGLTLLLICCCYCCCPSRSYSYSRAAYALSLIFLIIFTCAAIVGCVLLYTGQGKLHVSTSKTLDYVVAQADWTVENLRNFSDNLAAAKRVSVNQVFIPPSVQARIDEVDQKLNSSANELASRTNDNSRDIRDALYNVRLFLIIVAAVMLALTFLGFLLAVSGLTCPVYTLVIAGWILVAVTFILAGVFLVLHNVITDSCMAMDDWVKHPHEHTALDDILPCVDAATANESLYRSKEVTFQLASVVNQFIANVSNKNYPPQLALLYFNQSGPLVPLLCNPFNSDLTSRACLAGEVGFDNASQVWQGYVCNVSEANICISTGRITPTGYEQLVAANGVAGGSDKFGSFFANLQDCTFVRDTFTTIYTDRCPGLERNSQLVYAGLAVVSGAVLLSLVFWVVYTKERRHRKKSKQFIPGS